jgi:hypothetical protein
LKSSRSSISILTKLVGGLLGGPRPKEDVAFVGGGIIQGEVLVAEEQPGIDGVADATLEENEALANENRDRVKGMGDAREGVLGEVILLPLLGEQPNAVERARHEVQLARQAHDFLGASSAHRMDLPEKLNVIMIS